MPHICGYDPGRKGSVAWIDADTKKLLGVEDAGSAEPDTPQKLLDIFSGAAAVVIERPLAFRGIPAQDQMILAESYGIALACASLAGVPVVITPTASQWKASLGVTKVKSTSVLEAVRIFEIEGRKPRHDRAEAMLLAYYGWQQGGFNG